MVRKFLNLVLYFVVWVIVCCVCEVVLMQPHFDGIADTESVYYLNQGFGALVLYATIVMAIWLLPQWLPKLSGKVSEEEIGTGESRKKKYVWLVRCILILGILCVGCKYWYEVYSLDGVKVQHWMKTKEYSWEDVSYYTLDTDGKGLAMYLYMEDGTKVNVFGGSFTVSTTNEAFAREFPNDIYDYAIWMDEILEQQGCELRIKNVEDLHKKLMLEDYSVRKVAEAILE